MAAALATTRYRRLYESVVFKAVGATRAHIARSFAAEYAVMGGLAGLIGIVLANVLSWGVLYYVFDLPWTFQPTIIGTTVAAAMALSVAVGFLTTFRILGEPPLAILRHE
jgi:putative ABC transport system permease protein